MQGKYGVAKVKGGDEPLAARCLRCHCLQANVHDTRQSSSTPAAQANSHISDKEDGRESFPLSIGAAAKNNQNSLCHMIN
jgi:hypothetical protein